MQRYGYGSGKLGNKETNGIETQRTQEEDHWTVQGERSKSGPGGCPLSSSI